MALFLPLPQSMLHLPRLLPMSMKLLPTLHLLSLLKRQSNWRHAKVARLWKCSQSLKPRLLLQRMRNSSSSRMIGALLRTQKTLSLMMVWLPLALRRQLAKPPL
jgi:hypothetical protein